MLHKAEERLIQNYMQMNEGQVGCMIQSLQGYNKGPQPQFPALSAQSQQLQGGWSKPQLLTLQEALLQVILLMLWSGAGQLSAAVAAPDTGQEAQLVLKKVSSQSPHHCMFPVSSSFKYDPF